MKIEIDEQALRKIQSLTTVTLSARDYEYFADWLILVGVGWVNHALRAHPDLSLGDLVMMQYKFENN